MLTSTSGGQCDLEFLPAVARRSVADGGDPTRRMLERVMASTLSSTHTVERIHVRHVVVVQEQNRGESSNPSLICNSNRKLLLFAIPY
jgi:hypothetical protein